MGSSGRTCLCSSSCSVRLLFLVLLIFKSWTVRGVSGASRAAASERFVLQSNCTWSRPQQCGSKSSYKIDFHTIDADAFPRELKQSARVAANLWLRAIRSRSSRPIEMKVTRGMASTERCGITPGTRVKISGLLICLNFEDFGCESMDIPARAAPWFVGRSDKLPRGYIVSINSQAAGKYDRCDWNNIILHELGHALGFFRGGFLDHGLYYKDESVSILRGKNAKREWAMLSGSSSSYPTLTDDGNHWSVDCFEEELMQSSHHLGLMKIGNSRIVVSRLTLAVFADMGYRVDYTCADEVVSIVPTCKGGHGPPLVRRFHRNQHAVVRFFRRVHRVVLQSLQILRYQLLMDLTRCRKQGRRIAKHVRKVVQGKQRIANIRQKCRKLYRRVRRVARAGIRGASSSLGVNQA